MSENPVRRKFSRNIDIRRYFVRDMVAAGVVKLVPLRTHLMVADALTKSLPSHIKHRNIMLGHVPFSFAARTLRNFIRVMKSPLSLSFLPTTIPQRCRGHPSNFSCLEKKERFPLSQQVERERERERERDYEPPPSRRSIGAFVMKRSWGLGFRV